VIIKNLRETVCNLGRYRSDIVSAQDFILSGILQHMYNPAKQTVERLRVDAVERQHGFGLIAV
jgi:hypothetical protein